MNIRFLETFIWLSRLKNFRETAEKLNTTQPNISARVTSLEDQFKTSLYLRGRGEFQLTAAGRRLFEYAEKIVDLADEMQRAVAVTEEANEILRVGIIEMVTLSWLPDFINRIHKQESIGAVDFSTETTSALVDLLRRGELDVAFVWGPVNEPHMTNDYICSFALSWIGSPEYCQATQPMDVVDVAKLPIVPTRAGTSGHAIVREYFASYGVEQVPRRSGRVTLDSYSLATALQLVRTGLGVMALPPMLLTDELAAGSVVGLPVKQALPPVYLTACYPSASARPFVQRLVDAARESAAEYREHVDPAHYWL